MYRCVCLLDLSPLVSERERQRQRLSVTELAITADVQKFPQVTKARIRE